MKSYVGKTCVVRTYSSGVFVGEIAEMEGQVARVKHARRLWYWEGAASLSELAMSGVKRPENCKFPTAVDEVMLTQVVEVIPMTEEAITSIARVPIWAA